MKHLIFLVAAIGVLLFASCSKDDTATPNNNNNNNNNNKSKKDLVVDGKWQWTGLWMVYSNNGKDSLADGWSQVKECDKDDIMNFTADGKGSIDEMTNKCTNDPQTKSLTWEMLNNETEVKVIDDKGPTIMKIVELTATNAVYRQRIATGADSITIRQSFKNVK
ncbi:MAG: hypothetical protein EOO06_00510 [Chitinophagaceae bacterium]|nr:MAG: hypothetical protein EOO06_00510 [Chitinophagaceae bacterium]